MDGTIVGRVIPAVNSGNYPIYEKATEIIRCKNCKYQAPDGACNHPIEWDNGESRNHKDPEWFCADGERK